ncbi:uncharacterized protein B4U79_16317 [Dinothrombium tinctorium]|uniref:Nuclear receptor domain-containing protein n=1 Tax=Dinothrombium tinctorium TaxID=1965070 RepID=A0A3S3PBZ9_9ACAR|nr:uncharacterized protein B4U79_16375 [Dinothrombium tinctorium]RWS05423.1 uncharacterized protein B4U79_16319 [Dinothrombium tinctorium]RWS05443.1 uncharacterized protein B4U79_16317 [Dinothrombium tinctorium]
MSLKEGQCGVPIENDCGKSEEEMIVDQTLSGDCAPTVEQENGDRLRGGVKAGNDDSNDTDEALDLSFVSHSIPFKKRRLMPVQISNRIPSSAHLSSEKAAKETMMSKEQQSQQSTTHFADSQRMGCGRPGFITCSICNATKYYSHVQRRFGQFSCEPCSKFMKRFLKDPKIFTCMQTGSCQIGKPAGEQEPRGVSVSRCKACWLKICLEKFILDAKTRAVIDKFYSPKFNSEKVGNGKDKNYVSQNLPPPLPLPVRKRKTKSETATYPLASEPFPKRSARHQVALEANMETCATNNNSNTNSISSPTSSPQPSHPTSLKKSLALWRDSSSAEYQSKDLYPDDTLFEPSEECGKCTYCLHRNYMKANVVVVKESCKYKKCILSGLLAGDKEENTLLPPLISLTPGILKTVQVSKSIKSDAQFEGDSPINLVLGNNNKYNNKRNNRILKREWNEAAIGSDSNFLNEILNANSPFL